MEIVISGIKCAIGALCLCNTAKEYFLHLIGSFTIAKPDSQVAMINSKKMTWP